ncbi:DNA mismatch repair protein Mlh3-like isoform X1 [Acipenser oxyrinchus oxyrinchus]|uniref:DNA mismatch repair protein Mlh3-like isoform X1 n=1 Tax=Acipenser oxyrinchus oxyrinchus TaxID=40147 RepID=A0AAD8CFL3_ACIOX|nr:DNA mismatch repair protein Mlh3-like isoform X1 [Acipenser oxyrinchus oxyrinchus]
MDNNKETEKNIDLDPALDVEGSTACTQSEVIHVEGSTACTQSEVIHVEGSTACTQSEVIHVEGSTACKQSEVIHVEGSTACTQSEVIQHEKHNPAPQADKAINTESVRPKLGTTGFIHHVIPVRNGNENKNHEGLVRFCHRGPVSAQDIFKEKQHNLEQNTFLLKQQCCALTMQHVKQSSSEDWRTLFSSRGDTFSNCVDSKKQSDESNRKITLSNILKTVEDFKGSMDTMVGLSTGSQTKQRSKLSLPVRIGSLDRFRRICGKTCPSAVQYSCQDSNNNLSTATANNPAEAKRDASTSNEEDSCSRANNSSKNWERNDYTKEENAITLSDYTQIKKASLNTSKPHRSLATKLSKLKGYQKNDTKVQPVGDVSVSGAQKDSVDLRLTHSNNSNAETPSQMPPNKKSQVTNNCLKGCESGENNSEQNASGTEGNQKEGTVISATYLHPDTGYKGCTLISPSQSDDTAQCHYCNDDKEISSKAILGSPKKVNECSGLATCKARFEDASKKKEIPSTTQSSSDWVEHFDVSVGRMAYINTVTGLSKYVAPPEEETQAICTTDITTMAVNVVSEKVFCFKCFLFVSVNPINRSGARDPAPDSSQSPSFPSLPW